MTLRPSDFDLLHRVGITDATIGLARLQRVTHLEAREICGIRYRSAHLEGLAFPYLDPAATNGSAPRIWTWRIRRDHPELEADGKLIAKYVSPPDRKHLYFPPGYRDTLADTAIPVIVVESEKAALSLASAGRPYLPIGVGGCWGWRGVIGKREDADGTRVDEKGPLPDLNLVIWTNRDTVICFDANAATNADVRRARRALASELIARGAKVRIAELPIEADVNGPDDFIGLHGAEKFFALVDAAKPVTRDRTDLRALVEDVLDPLTSDSDAQDVRDALHRLKPAVTDLSDVDRATLKKIVLDSFAKKKIKNAREMVNAILFPAPKSEKTDETSFLVDDPADDVEQDGTVLFRELVGLIRRHVILDEDQAIVVALWIAHAYRMDAWSTSPLLLLTSATKRCGKSTLLAIISALVPKALPASNISAASLFRVVEAYQPTLLIDEADTFFREQQELRGIINAGHTRRLATVLRCEGESNEPRQFSTWAAKAIAMIGKPADTLVDRSWVIELRRKRPSETLASVRLDRLPETVTPLRRRLRRWAGDHREELMVADPDLPEGLHDRARDNARPLVAIAEAIGRKAAEDARAAIRKLAAAEEDDEAGAMLLADVRAWFDEHDDRDAVASKELADYLVTLEGRPWPEWRRGEPLTTNGLARLLKPFGITPSKIWILGSARNGYARHQFAEAWQRYFAADPPDQPEGWKNINKTGPRSEDRNRKADREPSSSKTAKDPTNTDSHSDLPDETPGDRAEEKKVGPEAGEEVLL